MGFELPNGKTARNLQEQVKFLSEKLKELYAAVNEIGIRVLVVDELPEEGEPLTIYFVPAEDASQENIYNEYMWVEDEWELIGSTEIDLSGYMTLSTNQTVSGEKTFTTDTYFTGKISFASDAYIDYSSSAIHIHNLYNTITINEGGTIFGDTCQAKGIQPISNNSFDLGTSSFAWKSLFTTGLKVDGTNGEIKASYTIQPATGASIDLGKSAAPWQNLYLSGGANIRAANAIANYKICSENGYYLDFVFTRDGATSEGSALSILYGSKLSTKSINPQEDNTYDLGETGQYQTRWRNLYISGNISDGTNSVSIADLAALITYAKGQGWIS